MENEIICVQVSKIPDYKLLTSNDAKVMKSSFIPELVSHLLNSMQMIPVIPPDNRISRISIGARMMIGSASNSRPDPKRYRQTEQ